MEKTNYCKMIDCLSRCTLVDVKEQYKCGFFVKASQSARDPNQCSHYRPDLNNHCDNTKAQMNAVNLAVKKEDIPTDFSY